MPDSLPKPVYLERLKVENIRSFESVEVEFSVPDSGGQWIVFLGDNGSGKSTLLQLIGLFVTDNSYNPFANDLRWAGRMIRLGQREGASLAHIAVESVTGVSVFTLVSSASSPDNSVGWHLDGDLHPTTTSPRYRAKQGPFIAGFGTNRADRDFDEGPKKGYDLVASLYDSPSMPSRGPIDPVKWLLGERLKTFEWSERGELFNAITDALQQLLPRVSAVNVTGDGVSLTFEPDEVTGDEITVPFASISEGYRATIIWLIDLLAGWLHTQTEENIKQWASQGKLLEAMTGVVLVDELDLHLHPTWQREIVPTLRRLFPNLTFIVTTHSPLIVQSAQDCEVFVVDRPSASSPSTVRKVELGASTVDKVLTSSAFGLESQLDPATSAKIAHARDLLAQGEAPDVQSLSDRLDEASGLVDQQVEALSQLPWAEARELIRARIEAKKRG